MGSSINVTRRKGRLVSKRRTKGALEALTFGKGPLFNVMFVMLENKTTGFVFLFFLKLCRSREVRYDDGGYDTEERKRHSDDVKRPNVFERSSVSYPSLQATAFQCHFLLPLRLCVIYVSLFSARSRPRRVLANFVECRLAKEDKIGSGSSCMVPSCLGKARRPTLDFY